MGGIRIRHKTLRGVTLALRDMTERIDPPYPVCSMCTLDIDNEATHVNHEGYKTRHFDLDSEGYVIVSEGVLEALHRHVDLGGFDISNEVKEPPPINISMGAIASSKPVVQER